jgi:hypothetical protein
MSDVVCTVTPTIQHGTVVRWYRSEIAAEQRMVMVSASRNGVEVGEHLMNGEVPSAVMADAAKVWVALQADKDADMSGWATHRRERTLGGSLVRIDGGEGGS